MGAQTLVGLAGTGLIAANLAFPAPNAATANDGHALTSILTSHGSSQGDAHTALVHLGAELAFVIVGVVLAGVSHAWAMAVGLAIAALWVLWAMNRYSGGVKPS
jgi:hypothetical protein